MGQTGACKNKAASQCCRPAWGHKLYGVMSSSVWDNQSVLLCDCLQYYLHVDIDSDGSSNLVHPGL